MKKISKIFIISLISLLFIGAVSATTNIDSLKAPNGFKEIKNGTSTLEKDGQKQEFYIDKYSEWESLYKENKTNLTTKNIGDTLYYFEYAGDASENYPATAGVVEKVKNGDTEYVAYILKEGKNLTNSEQEFCKDGVLSFNTANNLKPTLV